MSNTIQAKEINGIKIDPLIFTFKFSCQCNGECCYYGVYVDSKENQDILNIKDKIIPLMDDSQITDIGKWFEAPVEDKDFASGIAVGTELHNNKCVFLDKAGLCTLQKLALNEHEHKWKYKPLYCMLFPLTIFEGSLTIDDGHIDRLKVCNKNPVQAISIYEACQEELLQLFGPDGFAELEEYRKQYLNNENSREVA